MKHIYYLGLLFLFWSCSSDYRYERFYEVGEKYSYKMTTISQRGGGNPSKVTAYVTHEVIKNEKGIPVEKITWNRIANYGTGTNYDSVLNQLEPYEISLHADGSVDLPKVKNPFLSGLVADLNTFFVCLSPSTGIQKAAKVDEPYENPEPLIGDFSNGSTINYGKDCINLTHTLIKLDEQTASYESAFTAPEEGCSDIAFNENTPLFGKENIIMTRPIAGGKSMLFTGEESFTILSTIERGTGKLIKAEMKNQINFNMQTCEQNFEICSPKSPLTIERSVTLELI